jgi:dsRNA-specific ribonuclease
MSPLERSIHDFLDSRPDKNQGETSAVFGGLRDGHWQEDEKRAVAEWLKARLQESGKWREVSSKKNPAKDKEYQNTLKVKGWLEGKE